MPLGQSRPLRQAIWFDLKTAAMATFLGLITTVCVDFIASIWAAPGSVGIATAGRFLLLELALASLLFLQILPVMIALAWAARGARAAWPSSGVVVTQGESWHGLWGAAKPAQETPGKLAGWLWGLCVAGAVFLAASTVLSLRLSSMFKEPQLTAFVLAGLQLTLAVGCFVLASVTAKVLRRLAFALHGSLGAANPFGSGPAAGLALALLGWPLTRLVLRLLPQLGPLIEWRHMLSLASFTIGVYYSTRLLSRRGGLLPKAPRPRLYTVAASTSLALFLIPATLLYFGADEDTKSLAISSSPTMSRTMDSLRRLTDFDRDGFGSLLGENDCDPFNDKIHPMARDTPDNGIDEDCNGKDFRLGKLPSYKSGETLPVPEAFQEEWNFLLITVDTVRYDHTTFGGYGRDTTPHLAKLAKRSANFTFANAPSAGTMGSIPAIVTSKFFHSGIALDEDVPRGSPPRLKKENTLLAELFKQKGYRTGAILSHEYFNDWGMDQGVDDYDNSVGKVRAPSAVTSEILSERSIAWIGKQGAKKWFLWTHYIDPHGYYVSHPGDTSYGSSEMDLYDGELHFTDKHLATLLDYIARSPNADKTIIVITSDHGDAFGEHGYINHAQDLHREILHVPLIFYVPNVTPRNIPGAVSPIDIFPTFADMLGVNIEALNVEGVSLVPQLFHGKDASERIVFAETNYPKPLRAVVNSRYKLILDIKNNVSRLWDLTKDPLEKKNIWTKDKKGYAEMRGYLNEWLERVVYSRDAASNQAFSKIRDHLVAKRPKAALPVTEVSLLDRTIDVDSYELSLAVAKPGDIVDLALYLRAHSRPSLDLKFQIEMWVESGTAKTRNARSRLRTTGSGMFASSRWHAGELVRDRFSVTLPKDWKSHADGETIKIGLRIKAAKNEGSRPTWQGPLRTGSKDLLVIGEFTLSNEQPLLDAGVPGKTLAVPLMPVPANIK